MTGLNKNTKKAKAFNEAFTRAKAQGNTSIFDIYGKPSMEKMTIAENIEYLASKDKATVYYLGGNRFSFTCGYYRDIDGIGELIIFTKSNIYQIVM